jgi:hypothetical protein
VLLKQHRNAMNMDKSQLLLSNFTQKTIIFFSLDKKQQKRKKIKGSVDEKINK